MERYQKTRLTWNWQCHGKGCNGLETDIPVSDWPNPNEPHVHTITGIEATALPERRGEIELDIRRVSIGPTDARGIICDRLDATFRDRRDNRQYGIEWIEMRKGRGQFDPFVLVFHLQDGQHFCETAVRLTQMIMELFKIEDKSGYSLSKFDLTQETMIKFEENWITYANWLRIRFRLPVLAC